MEKEYTVKITSLAQSQLQEISRYVSVELKAPETALKLLNTLEAAIASLSQMPNRIALTDEEPWRSHGIHKMPVKNFLVYFWVDESAARVQVTSVVYGRRDQRQQLSKMEMH